MAIGSVITGVLQGKGEELRGGYGIASVPTYGEEPTLRCCSLRVLVPGLVGPEKGLLDEVFGLVGRTGQPERKTIDGV